MVELAHDEVFDKLMEKVGNDGPFQKKFNYIFNVGLVVFGAMAYMNIILALNVPEHWCYVPGRENTNITIEEWRNLTLPRTLDNRGLNSYSSCQMYNVSYTVQYTDYENWNFSGHNVVDCVHGYEYDKKWYESTAVSQEDWVCKKDLYQTNTFVFNRIGEVIGTFFFGQLGDTLGRRVIYYCSIFILLGGRILTLFTTTWYTAFAIASVFGSLTANSLFMSPLVIAMETSKPDNRAHIAMLQNLSWSFGLILMPLIFWWVRQWKIFILITTTPLIIFAFFPKYMIESPRWLANRGKFEQSAKFLAKVGRINGSKFEITGKQLQNMLPNTTEKVYGMASLFSGIRIAINTILLVTCWVICSLAYFVLILFIAQQPGNPFLNFIGQSVVEVPSFIIGQYLCNKIGRRLTNSFSFIAAAVMCIPIIFTITHVEWEVYSMLLSVTIKFCTTIIFFAINLQAIETYPTCLRQTGISLGVIMSNLIGIFGPYVVYLGTHFDNRYPYAVLLVLFTIGSICGLFLPETLHQKLPDSLEEAKKFGANQKFWSIPRPAKPEHDTEAETAELNPIRYAP